MNYYKDSIGTVYAYDDEQVAEGYGSGMTAISEEEAMAITNPPPQAQPIFDPTKELANPTVAEWDQLCAAAGATQLMKG